MSDPATKPTTTIAWTEPLDQRGGQPFCRPWWEDGVDGYEIECPNCGAHISSAPNMTPGGWRCDWCTEAEDDE